MKNLSAHLYFERMELHPYRKAFKNVMNFVGVLWIAFCIYGFIFLLTIAGE